MKINDKVIINKINPIQMDEGDYIQYHGMKGIITNIRHDGVYEAQPYYVEFGRYLGLWCSDVTLVNRFVVEIPDGVFEL